VLTAPVATPHYRQVYRDSGALHSIPQIRRRGVA
jgi:hypothetical protein